MDIKSLRTFEQLELFLRGFSNAQGDPTPYDFVGAYSLFLAIVENLMQYGLKADIESMKAMTRKEHVEYLKAILVAVEDTNCETEPE